MSNRRAIGKVSLPKMRPEDWAVVRERHPEIDTALRQVCNIHGSQPIFEENCRPVPLLLVRLQGLHPAQARAILDLMNADTVAPPDDESGDGDDENVEAEPFAAELDGDQASLVARAERLLTDLGSRQGDLLMSLSRMRSQVEQGMLIGVDDVADVLSWQNHFAEVSSLLAVPAENASLEGLADAVTRALAGLEAKAEDAVLADWLKEISAVSTDGGRMALAGVLERASGLVPGSMSDEEKELFRALYRVMSCDVPGNVDPGDADLIIGTFGLPAFLPAIGALAIHAATFPVGLPDNLPSATTSPDTPEWPLEDPPVADSQPSAGVPPLTVPELEVNAPQEPAAATPGQEPDVAPSGSGHPDATQAHATQAHATQAHATQAPAAKSTAMATPDPRLEAAVRAGWPGLAYWYTVALRLPAPVQAAFEVLALAESVGIEGDDSSVRIRELLGDFSVAAVAQNANYLKVLAAGSARALLRMPFSPCANVLYDAVALEALGGPDREFLKAVAAAGSFGFDISRAGDIPTQSIDEFVNQRDAAVERLRTVQELSRGARIHYPRANDVLRRILSDKEPVGSAISAVLTTPDDAAPGEAVLVRLRDQRAIDRLIDETDQRISPSYSRKGKIIAIARDQLRSHLGEVIDALRDYAETAHALDSRRRFSVSDQQTLSSAVSDLMNAAKDASSADTPADGVGAAAVARVRRWTHAALTFKPMALTVGSSPVVGDLSRAYEVSRLADGSIDPASVTTDVLDAVVTRTAEAAYEGFAALDDFAGADQLIETLRESGDGDLADQLAARRPEDVKVSRERLRQLAAKAEREIALARFAALLSESEGAELDAELARARGLDVDNFPVARARLDGIISTVKAAHDREIEKARRLLSALECTPEVRGRITDQLDDGDLVTAQEFIAQLTAGSSELPPETHADPTFGQFWPDFIREVTLFSGQPGAAEARWLATAAANGAAIAGQPLLPPEAGSAVQPGLAGWLLLSQRKRADGWERWLKDVLYLLGLEMRGPFRHSPSRSGQWATKIEAETVGRALVPAYGSAAEGRYQLLLCWGRRTPEQLLEMVEELPRQAPVVVLYFDSLSQRDRRMLAERSRNKRAGAVVIDHAVMAFLATRPTARLQTTMELTLPFTAINPYTPYVLGDVPREVFYGRQKELHDVQDADGPLFVYGGRQLGKSTLLKTAMREFEQDDPTNRRALYLDLKAEGIGERRESDDLWALLIPRLRDRGIVTQKVSERAGPDVVVGHIRNWLNEDGSRRFLLLLDEADAFLETDARARQGQAGGSRFDNVYRLKNLMDGSARRFKPVFAGLHQVQRFHSISNGPMAHVGSEILIGPLPPSEAYKLVVEPLAHIGYRFEQPDIAWRLLAYTNYQASLVQAFCNALVDRMHDRKLLQDSPPTIIRDKDIDEVYGDRKVRDWIATRFDLTINLDNRYRVIAYTTAFLTNATEQQVFEVSALQDECKYFWPTGFTSLNLDDFTAYLDEMVGLGVLVRTKNDEYGIRSPNVIRLLGSPAEIDRRLQESEEVLEINSLFDPAVFRRSIGEDPDRRSPLTEQQVKQLLEGRRQLHVILGTQALGLDRVREALEAAAPEDINVRPATCGSLHAMVTGLARTKGRQHLVLDLAASGEAEQRAAVRELLKFVSGNDRRTASCLAPPSADWLWAGDAPDGQFQRIHLTPWTEDTLRAWAPECQYPLSIGGDRRLLLMETGGWPLLVERAAQAARGGHAHSSARQEALSMVAGKEDVAAFLDSVGLPGDPTTSEVIAILVGYGDEITFDELATLAGALGKEALSDVMERLAILGVVSDGTRSDSYRLNPLIANLLRNQ